jgi:inorganic pyrophosphatase
VVTVEIEIPKGFFAKWRRDGRIDFVSPVPCPYNYGCIPHVQADDGDSLDALIIGATLARGERVTVTVRGVVDFRDLGSLDPKVVCSPEPLTRRDMLGLRAFFNAYAIAKRGLSLVRRRQGETRFVGLVLADEE